MDQEELVARLQKQFPNLRAMADRLQNDPRTALRAVRPARPELEGLESVEDDEGMNMMRAGASAMKKVSAKGAKAKLTPDEAQGLEAIILTTGRPAILVQGGSFGDPPPGWEVLAENRQAIESAIPSVGRIDVEIDGQRTHLGTGFVVGKNVIMTNRHVAKSFSELDKKTKEWTIWKTRTPLIDWLQEKDNKKSTAFRVKRVIGVHDNKDVDLALLEIEGAPMKGKAKVPPPLMLSKKPSKKAEKVYVIGYPKTDNSGDTPQKLLTEIFGDAFGVKRLQPGENDGNIKPLVFSHDCSTLGGSSGSCVLSLATNRVVGLHYSGTFKVRNEAVALWKLQDDPLVKKNVEFE